MDRQIYALTGRTLALTDVFPTQDAAGATEAGKNTIQEVKNLIRPYLVYTALITQSGGGTPTAKVLENTLGGTVVLARSSAGQYTLTLSSAFTVDKTFFSPFSRYEPQGTDRKYIYLERASANVINLFTQFGASGSIAFSDSMLTDEPIEIRVYS